jgi:vacuolar-type H+-ATPase subunit H
LLNQQLIEDLEENARLWELQALDDVHPKTRELLNKRAVRGRKLAERMRREAAAKAARLETLSRQSELAARLRMRPKL